VIFAKFINPGFINEIVEQARIKMQAKNNLTEDQIETALDYTRKFTTPVWLAIFGLFWVPLSCPLFWVCSLLSS